MREIKALVFFICLICTEGCFATEESRFTPKEGEFAVGTFPRRRSVRIHVPGLVPPLHLPPQRFSTTGTVPRSARSGPLALVPYRHDDPRNTNPVGTRPRPERRSVKNWTVNARQRREMKRRNALSEKRRQLLQERRDKATAMIKADPEAWYARLSGLADSGGHKTDTD